MVLCRMIKPKLESKITLPKKTSTSRKFHSSLSKKKSSLRTFQRNKAMICLNCYSFSKRQEKQGNDSFKRHQILKRKSFRRLSKQTEIVAKSEYKNSQRTYIINLVNSRVSSPNSEMFTESKNDLLFSYFKVCLENSYLLQKFLVYRWEILFDQSAFY